MQEHEAKEDGTALRELTSALSAITVAKIAEIVDGPMHHLPDENADCAGGAKEALEELKVFLQRMEGVQILMIEPVYCHFMPLHMTLSHIILEFFFHDPAGSTKMCNALMEALTNWKEKRDVNKNHP